MKICIFSVIAVRFLLLSLVFKVSGYPRLVRQNCFLVARFLA